jgi:hypothetical protein
MTISFGTKLPILSEESNPDSSSLTRISELQTDGTYKSFKVTKPNYLKKRQVVVTASHTITADEDTIISNDTTGDAVITLPTAVGIDGVRKTLKKVNSNAHTATLTPFGNEKIDGGTGITLTTQYDKTTVEAYAGNWITV